MKKQALAIAIASALVATPSFAAQDTAGMHYTSAAEGFYASIRVVWSASGSGQDDFTTDSNDGADIGGNWSRVGIRGNNDLGGGLEGFYQYEMRVDHEQDAAPKTRLANVGLRGNFGELAVGTFWNNLYNYSYGSTDIANNHSGHFVSSTNTGSSYKPFPNRINSAAQYTTPDLNGFEGSVLLVSDNSPQTATTTGTGENAVTTMSDENDLDSWGLAAKYAVQGFSVAGTYWVNTDAISKADSGKDDQNVWTFKLGYSQDNWYVNGWYGEDNTSKGDATEDSTYFSVGGGVTIDKVALYALYEQNENAAKQEDSYGTIGAQYNLGSQSRTFVEYNSQDLDSSPTADDRVILGLRHDF